jgi:hypothetical protein
MVQDHASIPAWWDGRESTFFSLQLTHLDAVFLLFIILFRGKGVGQTA